MKLLGVAFALGLGALVFTSPVQAQTVEWRGGGYIKVVTDACSEGEWAIADTTYVSVRYRPPRMGSNGPGARLGIFHPLFFANSYRLETGAFTRVFRQVLGGATSATTWRFENTARLRMVTQPARVVRTTPAIRLTGQIQNYSDLAGCTVDYDFNLTRQP